MSCYTKKCNRCYATYHLIPNMGYLTPTFHSLSYLSVSTTEVCPVFMLTRILVWQERLIPLFIPTKQFLKKLKKKYFRHPGNLPEISARSGNPASVTRSPY